MTSESMLDRYYVAPLGDGRYEIRDTSARGRTVRTLVDRDRAHRLADRLNDGPPAATEEFDLLTGLVEA